MINILLITAYTINCVCHIIRSVFRVLEIYNFAYSLNAPISEVWCHFFKYFCDEDKLSIRGKLELNVFCL